MESLKRTKIKALLAMEPGVEVLAKGWVRTKRGNKQVKFIALNDGSTINNIIPGRERTAGGVRGQRPGRGNPGN